MNSWSLAKFFGRLGSLEILMNVALLLTVISEDLAIKNLGVDSLDLLYHVWGTTFFVTVQLLFLLFNLFIVVCWWHVECGWGD